MTGFKELREIQEQILVDAGLDIIVKTVLIAFLFIIRRLLYLSASYSSVLPY